MTLLLDTHVLLWWLNDSPALSKKARQVIGDGGTAIFVSAASIWEIVIKEALNKLVIPPEFPEAVAQQSFEYLAISAGHAYAVGKLPAVHRDPFDRMLVAQCLVEGLTLVSHDDVLKQYGIRVLEA